MFMAGDRGSLGTVTKNFFLGIKMDIIHNEIKISYTIIVCLKDSQIEKIKSSTTTNYSTIMLRLRLFHENIQFTRDQSCVENKSDLVKFGSNDQSNPLHGLS